MSSSSLKDRIWRKLTLSDDPVEFREYQTTWLLRLCRRFREAVVLLLVSVPPLYEAFVIRGDKGAILRAAVQFSFGLFLGLMFYLCILIDLLLDDRATYMIALGVTSFLAFGNVLSSQIRCISFLVPLRFGTTTGRNIIMALILVHLTAGPISNITTNLQEALRVIICQLLKMFTLTKNKFEMMFVPFGEALVKMRADPGDETKELVKTLDDAHNVVKKELLDDEDLTSLKEQNDYIDDKTNQTRVSDELDAAYRVQPGDNSSIVVEKSYMRKLHYRCQNVLSTATSKCRKMMEEVQSKCYNQMPSLVRLGCKTLGADDLCNLKSRTHPCNTKKAVSPDLGRTYTYFRDSKEKVKVDLKEVKFHYTVPEVSEDTKKAAKDMFEASRNMIGEYKQKKGLLQSFITLIMRIAAFSFLFIIISCNNYISNYLTDIEEDNMYITLYFRKIDYRRFIKGKFTLLPLKSSEKRELSDVYRISLTTAERAEFLHALIGALLMLFFTIIFVSIDYLLYGILEDIKIYGNISYEQIGHHDLELQIKGVGFIASILRSIAHGFTVKRRLKKRFTNEECLPNPQPPGKYNFKIFGGFFLLFMLAWMNVFVLKRLSRCICGMFYPKAEKKRIIFLYNQTLKKRITYLNYRLDLVRKEAREKKIPEPLTFSLALRIKHPKLFSWILYFNQGRRNCIICHEAEPKTGGENRCTSINCYLYYCQQCWDFVVKRKCIGCPKYVDKLPEPEDV